MTADAWITAGVLLVTLVALAASRYPPSAIVMAATVTLLVLGVIDTTQAFAGFSDSAVITIAGGSPVRFVWRSGEAFALAPSASLRR